MDNRFASRSKWKQLGITSRDELKSRIMAVFEKSDHQEQVLIGLYRMVFPDWDQIVKIASLSTTHRFTHRIWSTKATLRPDPSHPIINLITKVTLNLNVCDDSDIVPATLRIQGLSGPKNLFPKITADSKIFSCPKEIRFPSRLPVWMASFL